MRTITIERYLERRDYGMTLEEIQKEEGLSEATVWTLELGYQCYLKSIPLDRAIDLIINSK